MIEKIELLLSTLFNWLGALSSNQLWLLAGLIGLFVLFIGIYYLRKINIES